MLNENVFDEPDWANATNGYSHDRSSAPSFDPFHNYEQSYTTSTYDPPASTTSEPALTNTTVKPMNVRVEDPQKQSATMVQGYISYLVTTETSVETFSSPRPRSVRRRYQDFVWLHDALELEYPVCIVPPLPEKHRLAYLNGDRFSQEFLEKRRYGLQWFLNRVASHPVLQKAQCTRIFLESDDFKNDKRAIHAIKTNDKPTFFDTLGDVLMNAFAAVKKPDQRFLDMQDYVDKLEDNIITIEKLYSRISQRQTSLIRDYTNFAWSIREISAMESSIAMPLRQFAETTETYGKYMKEMNSTEELLFMNDLHELLAYCHSVKDILQKRDESQIDFEELSTYLQRAIEERDKIANSSPAKLAEIEQKIQELQDEVTRTSDITTGFSEQMTEEFETFQTTKTTELKQGLTAYADSHISFYTKSMKLWESILPALENIKLDDEVDRSNNVDGRDKDPGDDSEHQQHHYNQHDEHHDDNNNNNNNNNAFYHH
ncbi:hypothetical protein BDB00DRAFT_868938 [Zychaea mexicana]|uniref:uncharacterized protein n=1 Tax=Zychaea mexicana TaxID=64656 RepID=UPI0022FE4873|nr:uncharacterized protein BDB00DRAFT_868938 [Zychaea mexicana]KAI9497102.1 hypothetical protein BDB00DRAFT_868938 [Zychaea mexicana]